MTMITRARCLRVKPLPARGQLSACMRLDDRKLTAASELGGLCVVRDDRDVRNCGCYSRADSHPERLPVGKAVIESMLHAKHGHGDDIYEI